MNAAETPAAPASTKRNPSASRIPGGAAAKKAPARTRKAAASAPVLEPEAPAEAAPVAARPGSGPRQGAPDPRGQGQGRPGRGAAGAGSRFRGGAARPACAAAGAANGGRSALVSDQARAVLQAIQEGRAVELLFADAESNPPRTFEPRQLIFDTFAKGWYVWGWDRRYNAERHHLLSLIAQVNPVEGMGRAAQGPYKEGTPANLIGGWLGGEPIHVKAILLKQWIFAVRQAPAPFPDFTIEDLEEGKAQVTFTATDLRAITRWVMQFGDGIQVLEPQRLLDRVKQVGLAWAGKNAPAAAPAQAPAPAQPQTGSPAPGTPLRAPAGIPGRAPPGTPARSQAPSRPRSASTELQAGQAREDRDPHRPAVGRPGSGKPPVPFRGLWKAPLGLRLLSWRGPRGAFQRSRGDFRLAARSVWGAC